MEHRLTVLHIETTTACNLRCGHCTRVLPDYQVHSMPWEVFEKLIPAMREHQPSVLLNGHGEPLVHPDFRRQFAAVTSCDCSVRFQTNGQRLTRELTGWLLGSGTWERLDVSVDGATAATYEGIRNGASLDVLRDNLRAFQMLRGEAARPSLHFEFVVMKQNIAELPAVVTMAACFGAESVLVTDLQETAACAGWSATTDREALTEALMDAAEVATNARIHLQLPRPSAELVGQPATWKPCASETKVCRTPWNVAYVTPEGNVHPCCRIAASMGNVADGGLDAVLHGEAWRGLLDRIEAGDLPEECRGCPWV